MGYSAIANYPHRHLLVLNDGFVAASQNHGHEFSCRIRRDLVFAFIASSAGAFNLLQNLLTINRVFNDEMWFDYLHFFHLPFQKNLLSKELNALLYS